MMKLARDFYTKVNGNMERIFLTCFKRDGKIVAGQPVVNCKGTTYFLSMTIWGTYIPVEILNREELRPGEMVVGVYGWICNDGVKNETLTPVVDNYLPVELMYALQNLDSSGTVGFVLGFIKCLSSNPNEVIGYCPCEFATDKEITWIVEPVAARIGWDLTMQDLKDFEKTLSVKVMPIASDYAYLEIVGNRCLKEFSSPAKIKISGNTNYEVEVLHHYKDAVSFGWFTVQGALLVMIPTGVKVKVTVGDRNAELTGIDNVYQTVFENVSGNEMDSRDVVKRFEFSKV